MSLQIPNETAEPNPAPRSTNPLESQLIRMTNKADLQQELDSVRANYQKWKERGDHLVMRTQTRLAQIIHFRANQIGVTLQ